MPLFSTLLFVLSVIALQTAILIPKAQAQQRCVLGLASYRVLTGKFPKDLGLAPGNASVAADAKDEVLWAGQGMVPGIARIYLYTPKKSLVRQIQSPLANTSGRIGNIGLSPSWIVFAQAQDPMGGAFWRIVAYNRKTAKERIIASGAPGGFLSGQFSLDDNVLAWIQPLASRIQVRDEDLRTGKMRVLASTPNYNNLYDWVQADKGHVVLEWNHLVRGQPSSDVLLASEGGGPVIHLTADGESSQPTISWPYIAFLDAYHFSRPKHVIIMNVLNRKEVLVAAAGDTDLPRIGNNLLIFRPGLPGGLLAYYVIDRRERIMIRRERTMTVDGAYMGLFALRHDVIAFAGTRSHAVHGENVSGDYVIVVARSRDVTGCGPGQ